MYPDDAPVITLSSCVFHNLLVYPHYAPLITSDMCSLVVVVEFPVWHDDILLNANHIMYLFYKNKNGKLFITKMVVYSRDVPGREKPGKRGIGETGNLEKPGKRGNGDPRGMKKPGNGDPRGNGENPFLPETSN